MGCKPTRKVESRPINLDAYGTALTPDEARAVLRISRDHIYNLLRHGDLPSKRLGRRIIIPKAALENWLQNLPSLA